MTRRARSGSPGEDRRVRGSRVLAVGVGDVGVAAPGSRSSISCRSACTDGDRLGPCSGDPVTAAIVEVEPGVGLPVLGRVGGRRRPSSCAVVEQVARLRRRASRAAAMWRRPARRCGGRPARRSQSLRCAARRAGRGAGRRRPRLVASPPCRRRGRGVVSTSPACRSAAIASRSVARETSSRSASSRSGGSVRAARVDPEPDRGGELLDAAPRRRGARGPAAAPPRARLDAGSGGWRSRRQSRDTA